MHDATKRFEIETLLKAGLAKARVAEIAGVSLQTVHRGRAEVDARSAETERPDTEAGTEAQPGLRTLEVVRRARLAGYGGGKAALYSGVCPPAAGPCGSVR